MSMCRIVLRTEILEIRIGSEWECRIPPPLLDISDHDDERMLSTATERLEAFASLTVR